MHNAQAIFESSFAHLQTELLHLKAPGVGDLEMLARPPERLDAIHAVDRREQVVRVFKALLAVYMAEKADHVKIELREQHVDGLERALHGVRRAQLR